MSNATNPRVALPERQKSPTTCRLLSNLHPSDLYQQSALV
jgi:hypothetical protein